MNEFISHLERKIVSLITEKIEAATTPLPERIDALESKLLLFASAVTEKIEFARKPMMDKIYSLENKLVFHKAHLQELEAFIDY